MKLCWNCPARGQKVHNCIEASVSVCVQFGVAVSMCYIFDKWPLSRKSLWCLCLWLHTVNKGMHGKLYSMWLVILGSATILFVMPNVYKGFCEIIHIYMPIRECSSQHGDEKQGNVLSFIKLGKKLRSKLTVLTAPRRKLWTAFKNSLRENTFLSYVTRMDFTNCSVYLCVHFTAV